MSPWLVSHALIFAQGLAQFVEYCSLLHALNCRGGYRSKLSLTYNRDTATH